MNPFTSKFDYYAAGEVDLTPQEQLGHDLLNGEAGCAACHPAPLFTDFTYDNIGSPRNPWYDMPLRFNPEGEDWVDPGLGAFLAGVPEHEHLALQGIGVPD